MIADDLMFAPKLEDALNRLDLPKISRFAPECMGIDLDKLLSDVNTVRRELIRLGPEWQANFDINLFPTIELSK